MRPGRHKWIVAFLREPGRATLVAEVAGLVAGFATIEGRYLNQLVVAQASKGSGIARDYCSTLRRRGRAAG